MKTKVLDCNQIDQAVNLLKQGEVVAVPTETVYGLAADACNDRAVHKIFVAKGRPADHPLIVHVSDIQEVANWAAHISQDAQKLATAFWPGPLTMVFVKKPDVSHVITGGQDTVAVRIPRHEVTLEIIKKLGNAIVAPSANSYQKTSPTKPEHVLKTLDGKIAAVVDGGQSTVGIESTIVDMTQSKPVILRLGDITAAMIEQVLGFSIDCPMHHTQKVSGNMEIHYQPDKPLYVLTFDDIQKCLKTERNVAVMHYSDMIHNHHAVYYKMSTDKKEYAQQLYNMLHGIDSTRVEKIFVEQPPLLTEWSDVLDRLIKASKK